MDELVTINQKYASQRQFNIELGKIMYMQRYCKKMVYCYSMCYVGDLDREEERLFRIVLIRDDNRFEDYINYGYPMVSRHEVHEPNVERWKFVMNHINDDLGFDTSDHRTSDEAIRNGLVFIYIDKRLQ